MDDNTFFVQTYVFSHRFGRGCTCTLRTPTQAAMMMMRHGNYWEDRNGQNSFEGPFTLEEAKEYIAQQDYYIPAMSA